MSRNRGRRRPPAVRQPVLRRGLGRRRRHAIRIGRTNLSSVGNLARGDPPTRMAPPADGSPAPAPASGGGGYGTATDRTGTAAHTAIAPAGHRCRRTGRQPHRSGRASWASGGVANRGQPETASARQAGSAGRSRVEAWVRSRTAAAPRSPRSFHPHRRTGTHRTPHRAVHLRRVLATPRRGQQAATRPAAPPAPSPRTRPGHRS